MPAILGMNEGAVTSDLRLETKNRSLITKKTMTEVYTILGDAESDTEVTIRTKTPNLPQLFDVLRGMIVESVEVAETENVVHPVSKLPACLWEATVSYTSDLDIEQNSGGSNDDSPDGGPNENPDRKPATLSWSTELAEVRLVRDAITGAPLVTDGTNEPIIVSTTIPIAVLRINRIEKSPFPPATIHQYTSHTNSQIFYGAPSGCALMDDITSNDTIINNRKYVDTTYTIKFQMRTWPNFEQALRGDEPTNGFFEDGWAIEALHEGVKHKPRDPENPNDDPIGKPPGPVQVWDDESNGQVGRINLQTFLGRDQLGRRHGNTFAGCRVLEGFPPEYKVFNRYPKTNFNALSLGGGE